MKSRLALPRFSMLELRAAEKSPTATMRAGVTPTSGEADEPLSIAAARTSGPEGSEESRIHGLSEMFDLSLKDTVLGCIILAAGLAVFGVLSFFERRRTAAVAA